MALWMKDLGLRLRSCYIDRLRKLLKNKSQVLILCQKKKMKNNIRSKSVRKVNKKRSKKKLKCD